MILEFSEKPKHITCWKRFTKISTHNLNYLPYSALIYEEFEGNEAQIYR
jgi:hypothetical protein